MAALLLIKHVNRADMAHVMQCVVFLSQMNLFRAFLNTQK